ncbi:putative membrane protein [Babesia divergens]|uniref:Membrane protein n=1 Tax=Babesia divergens TaxID=32595 RepID=A0AAD9GHC1_BABDI|nr:putative membrane protein [Babesia divergens]
MIISILCLCLRITSVSFLRIGCSSVASDADPEVGKPPHGGLNSTVALAKWHPFPSRMKVIFTSDATCDAYPVHQHEASNITLLCNSISIRNGSPLTLALHDGSYTPWLNLWSVSTSLYQVSGSTKSEVESIDFMPGESKELMVCLHHSANKDVKAITCRQFTLRMFLKYFNIRSDFYYQMNELWKLISGLFSTGIKRTDQIRLFQSTAAYKGANEKSTIIPQEYECILSPDSARLCNIQVQGNAKLVYPFDPYNSTLYVNVIPCMGDATDEVWLNIANQRINGTVHRRLILFVDGARVGMLPQKINVGSICNDVANGTRMAPPLLLTTLNEQSSYRSFMIIHFVVGKKTSDEIMSIYGSYEDGEFIKIEEIDLSGVVVETDYEHRRPHYIVKRQMVKEVHLVMKSGNEAVLSLFILDRGVNVSLNGFKLSSGEYKIPILCRKTKILLQDQLFECIIIVSCGSPSRAFSLYSLLWWIYITAHFVANHSLECLDSFVAYKIAGLHLGWKSIGTPGSLLVHPFAIFTKDLMRTQQFCDLLLFDVCMVCVFLTFLVIMLLHTLWPSKFRIILDGKLPYIAMLFNCSYVIMMLLHLQVYNSDQEMIYIMGYAIPDVYFRLSSFLILGTTSLVGGFTSIQCIFLFLQYNKSMSDQVGQVSTIPNNAEINGKDSFRCFVERGKLYKLHFTEVNGGNPAMFMTSECREIDVVKVASVPISRHSTDSDVKFLSIKHNIKGFEDMKLIAALKLKDLELISLMKTKMRVWCLINDMGRKSVKQNQVSNMLLVLSVLCDCFLVSLLLIFTKLYNLGLIFVSFQLLLKLSAFTVSAVLRYKKLKAELVGYNGIHGTSIYKLCQTDVVLMTLLSKCIRTLALSIYLCIQNGGSDLHPSGMTDVIKFCLLSWSFNAGFPIIPWRNCVKLAKASRKKLHVAYSHLLAICRYMRLGCLPNVIRRVKYLYRRFISSHVCDENGFSTISHIVPPGVSVPIVDLRILDAFRCAHRLHSDTVVIRNLFIHPSLELIYADVSPKCTIESYGFASPKRLTYGSISAENKSVASSPFDDSTNCVGAASSGHDKANGDLSNQHDATWLGSIEQTNLVNNNSLRTSEPEGISCSTIVEPKSDLPAETLVDVEKYNSGGYDRLFGIIEWRSPPSLGKPSGKRNSPYFDGWNNGGKLYLYTQVRSLGQVRHLADGSKAPIAISYEGESNFLIISSPFIIPLEKYSVHVLIRHGETMNSTTVTCCVICINNSEIEFDLSGELSKQIEIRVVENESKEEFTVDPNLTGIYFDNLRERATILNEGFKLHREYTVTYQALNHKSNLQFIHHGPSHEVLNEIKVPTSAPLNGRYDFIICDKLGTKRKVCSVNLDRYKVDRYSFGMKSKVMNPTTNIYLKHNDKDVSYYANDTFYFHEASDEMDHSQLIELARYKLRVKKCQYILGDNMSFLVPITIYNRISSMHSEDTFRVEPHYDVLANDLKLRIYTLKYVLNYIQLDLLLPCDSNTIDTDLVPRQARGDSVSSKNTNSSTSSHGYISVNHLSNYHSPEILLNGLIVSLFSSETLEAFVPPFPYSPTKLPKLFVQALRTVLMFCINQLDEAVAVLLRQHDLATSVSVKTEMQHFDTLTRQGMMVEKAKTMLKKQEHYNCFLHFPFVLNSDDIHARVNVGLELDRMRVTMRNEYRTRGTLLEHENFIMETLTEHLLGHTDLKNTLNGFCHVIVPSNPHRKLSIRNNYCFVKMPTTEVIPERSLDIWAPCFISLNDRMIQLLPSDRILHGGHTNQALDFTLVSLDCTISSEPINVLGSNKTMEGQVEITLRVLEVPKHNQALPTIPSFIDDGIMILRSHRRLFDFWQLVSRTFPFHHVNMDETVLFDSTFDYTSEEICKARYTMMTHRMSPKDTIIIQPYPTTSGATLLRKDKHQASAKGNAEPCSSISSRTVQPIVVNRVSTRVATTTQKSSPPQLIETSIPMYEAWKSFSVGKPTKSHLKLKGTNASRFTTNHDPLDSSSNITNSRPIKSKSDNIEHYCTLNAPIRGCSPNVFPSAIHNTNRADRGHQTGNKDQPLKTHTRKMTRHSRYENSSPVCPQNSLYVIRASEASRPPLIKSSDVHIYKTADTRKIISYVGQKVPVGSKYGGAPGLMKYSSLEANPSRIGYFEAMLDTNISSMNQCKLRSKQLPTVASEVVRLDDTPRQTSVGGYDYVDLQDAIAIEQTTHPLVMNTQSSSKHEPILGPLARDSGVFRNCDPNKFTHPGAGYISSDGKSTTLNDTTCSARSMLSRLKYRSRKQVDDCVSTVEGYMRSYLVDAGRDILDEGILPNYNVVYKGGMVHQLLDGRGRISCTTFDGFIYEGEWCMNERHGEGTMTYMMVNGSQCSIDCRWFKNIPIGRATIVKSRVRGFNIDRVSLYVSHIDLGPSEDLCNSDFVDCLYSTRAYHIINNDLFVINGNEGSKLPNYASFAFMPSIGSIVRSFNRRPVNTTLEGRLVPDCIQKWLYNGTFELEKLLSCRISTNVYGKCMDGVSEYFGPINNNLEPHTANLVTEETVETPCEHSTMRLFMTTDKKLCSLQLGTFRNKQVLYIGEWRDALPHGWGFMVLLKRNYSYCGEFRRGRREGHGLERHGDVYHLFGKFSDDALMRKEKFVIYCLRSLPLRFFSGTVCPNGYQLKGVPPSPSSGTKYRCHVIYKDNTQYLGHISGIHRSGFGVLLDSHGDMIYRGTWRHDLPGGTGISLDGVGLYLGGFSEGKFNGFGIYILNNESRDKFNIGKFKGKWEAGRLIKCLEIFVEGHWIGGGTPASSRQQKLPYDSGRPLRHQPVEHIPDTVLQMLQDHQEMRFSVESCHFELLDMVTCISTNKDSFVDCIVDYHAK